MKKPISNTVISLSHTPQYKMHKYFARRPYNVFSNIVNHYTNKGDIILDIFCGGGVTVFEGCNLKRNVIGVDLNPLATFITKMQMFNGSYDELKSEIFSFIKRVIEPLNIYYCADLFGIKGICKWIEWTYIVKCPKCDSDIVLLEKNKKKNGYYICPNKNCECHNGVARTKCIPKNSIPIRIKYTTDSSKVSNIHILSQKEIECLLKYENKLNKELDSYTFPSFKIPLNWDRQKEDKLYEKGIIRYEDLFSKRNLLILSKIFKEIDIEKQKGNKYVDYLYLIFSSTLRYTNKMSKVTENWEGGNPTCMDKHAYYFPNTFIENNVVNVFKDRAKAVLNGCLFSSKQLSKDCKETYKFNFDNKSCKYWIINDSSDNLPLPDESIDVVITDPPYGSNVQYAELSVVWNAWYQLYAKKDKYIYREKEAVSNRKNNYKGAKNESDYEKLLFNIFREAYRVLKNNTYMIFTFNNKNLNVWLAMLKAVAKSGFVLAKNGILFQDFISSYKNTSHLKYAGNIQGDFIYSFIKSDKNFVENYEEHTLEEIIDESIKETIRNIFINKINKIESKYLYKELFIILAKNLIKLINYKTSIGKETDSLNFEEKSIDTHLEKYVSYSEGYWFKKDIK